MKERPTIAALSVVIGFLVYRIPMVRRLVWLNAAALSNELGARRAVVLLGILEMLAIMTGVWVIALKLVTRWREKNHA